MINPGSELAAKFWQHGRVDDCPILDFHAHMGHWAGAYMPGHDVDSMKETMDQCNIRWLFFASHEAISAPGTRSRYDMGAVRKYPDRMRSYFGVHAHAPDLAGDLEYLKANQDVFVGIKHLPSYCNASINDDAYTPFYEYLDAHGLLFLCHTWEGNGLGGIDEVEKFLRNYPNIVFVAGHSFHSDWQEAARLGRSYANCFLELTAVPDERGGLEVLLADCGSHKLLFGTDLPWFHTHYYVGAILDADMSDNDRRNIFYRNGEKILRRLGLDVGPI